MDPGSGAYLFNGAHSLHNLSPEDLRPLALHFGYVSDDITPKSTVLCPQGLLSQAPLSLHDFRTAPLEELAQEALRASPTGVVFARLKKPASALHKQIPEGFSNGMPIYALTLYTIPTLVHRAGTDQLMIKSAFGNWSE